MNVVVGMIRMEDREEDSKLKAGRCFGELSF